MSRPYGLQHRHERSRWAAIVAAGDASCDRCGRPIGPGDPFHLSHDHVDGAPDSYRGVSHPRCNTAERNKRVNPILAAKRRRTKSIESGYTGLIGLDGESRWSRKWLPDGWEPPDRFAS